MITDFEIIKAIDSIKVEKDKKNIVPNYSLLTEIYTELSSKEGYNQDEVREQLRRMIKEGILKYGNTINGVWIRTR
jgi:hypothetical protein